jgi:hypothetical protein
MIVLLALADASRLPSGENVTSLTKREWPSSVCSAASERASHNLTVLSSAADASSLPSGEKATALITVHKVFGDQARKELPIPVFIDDYNHYMGGVDIADQLRSYYSTQRISLRCWFPLFFKILDSAILNAYLLCKQLHGPGYMKHKDFREVL